MDAVTISFSIGLLIFLLGLVGFVVYMLFCLWKNHGEIVRQKKLAQEEMARRKRWAQEFAQEFGVALPSGFVVQKTDDALSSGHFWLKYPYWARPKVDGTRDRRLSNNSIIRPLNALQFSHWKIESHDPWEMYCLVQQLREKGQRISPCKEEKEKKAALSKQFSQTEANSVFEIVSRYEESPTGFEHFCADIFRQLGYKAEVTPPANDGGYDILLSRDGKTAIVECKCYAADHKVGRQALQKLVGANSSMRAGHMWFVTTSSFSAPATAYGKEQGIQMIDGKRLLELIARSNGAKKKQLDACSLSLTRADFRVHIPPDIPF